MIKEYNGYRHDVVEVDGTILAVTDKAILFDVDGHTEEWFPKSHVENSEYIGVGDVHEYTTLTVSEWVANKKGIF